MEGLLEILTGLVALAAALLGEARAAHMPLLSWPALGLVAAGLVAGFLLGRRRRPASEPQDIGPPFPRPVPLDLEAIRPLGDTAAARPGRAPSGLGLQSASGGLGPAAEEEVEARLMDVSGIRTAEGPSPSDVAPVVPPGVQAQKPAVQEPPPAEPPKPPRPVPAQKPRPSPPR